MSLLGYPQVPQTSHTGSIRVLRGFLFLFFPFVVDPRNQFGLTKAKTRIYEETHRINVKAGELQMRKEPEKRLFDRRSLTSKSKDIISVSYVESHVVQDSISNESPLPIPYLLQTEVIERIMVGSSHQGLLFFHAVLVQALITKQVDY